MLLNALLGFCVASRVCGVKFLSSNYSKGRDGLYRQLITSQECTMSRVRRAPPAATPPAAIALALTKSRAPPPAAQWCWHSRLSL